MGSDPNQSNQNDPENLTPDVDATERGTNSTAQLPDLETLRRRHSLVGSRRWRQPTEDEELLNHPSLEVPSPFAPEQAQFTHTDPWRVLRIQGEFVMGFNALAEVGAAVAVFGSARTKEGHRWYEDARTLGRKLAQTGFAVITGGGPGLMEAVHRGAAEADGLSLGCHID